MPRITIIEYEGQEHDLDVDVGTSVMQAAVDNHVSGILGDCGGVMSCATCHCYVDQAWFDKVGEADNMEQDMLEVAIEPRDNSRLSCQITMDDALDGLVISLPRSQF